jgi:hypothetical protein
LRLIRCRECHETKTPRSTRRPIFGEADFRDRAPCRLE